MTSVRKKEEYSANFGPLPPSRGNQDYGHALEYDLVLNDGGNLLSLREGCRYPAEILFPKDYTWRSGHSAAPVRYPSMSRAVVDCWMEFSPDKWTLPHILDVGGNDGTFVRSFDHGVATVVDPCVPHLKRAFAIRDHFTPDSPLCCGHFDIVIARNVVCHVDDPRSFISGLSSAAKMSESVCLIELQDLDSALKMGNFFNFYHEHKHHASCRWIVDRMEEEGFVLRRRLTYPDHGGTTAMIFSRGDLMRDNLPPAYAPERLSRSYVVSKLEEMILNMHHGCHTFADAVNNTGLMIMGASAKWSTLLQQCSNRWPHLLRSEKIHLTDNHPENQSRFIPGTNILIRYVDSEWERTCRSEFIEAYPEFVQVGHDPLRSRCPLIAEAFNLTQKGE